MNVSTLTIEPDVAEERLEQYTKRPTIERTDEDQLLIKVYRQVAKGKKILNILDAFSSTGVNDQLEPKLAISRADFKSVVFEHGWLSSNNHENHFSPYGKWDSSKAERISFQSRFLAEKVTHKRLVTATPHIPPDIRPEKPHLYHVLFEVESWQVYNKDPFLLKNVYGYLYSVEAEWELTDLEASLLGMMREV